MKKILAALVLILCSGTVHAQLGVNIITDSLSTISSQFQQAAAWVQQASDMVQQIQATVKQLQDADQMLQYQIQVAQSLESGGWDGFVAAYAQETAAINQFNTVLDDFNNYSSPAIKAMLADPNYKDLATQTQLLDRSMQASNAVVQQTNTLVQDTSQAVKTSAELNNRASQNKSMLAQLQIQNQQLGLLAQVAGDSHMVLTAMANSIAVEQANQIIKDNLARQTAKNMLATSDGKAIWGQSDPAAHWKAMTDVSAWTDGN